MKYKLKVYSIWEYGQRKDSQGNPHQEDCTYPMPNELKDTDRTFILCDGMGGHDAGEVASATVCQSMGNYILNDSHDADGIFSDDKLKEAIATAFSALDEKDNGAEKKMGTTMTFLKLHNDGATVAHMGDSRVYHIRPGKDGANTQILFVTEDHSLINDLIKTGELTKEEARHSKQRNVITRAMQPNMEYKPKADIYHTSDIKVGDYFYMCSDGMLEQSDMEEGESIRNIFSDKIKSAERKVEILREVTKENRDNHTAIIIHIEDVFDIVSESKTSLEAVDPKRVGIVEETEAQATTDSSKISYEKEADENTENEQTGPSTQLKAIPNETEENICEGYESVNSIKHTHKQAVLCIIAIIVVTLLAIGIKYVWTLNKINDEKIERTLNGQPDKKRKAALRRNKNQSTKNKVLNQTDKKTEEVVSNNTTSNANTSPETSEETQTSSEHPLINSTNTNITLPNLSSDEVVNSDEQNAINNIRIVK